MTHTEFISTLTRAVRERGAAAALAELRATKPALAVGTDADAGYHDTAAVFYVWAVERLVTAGRTDLQIVWHPLTDPRSLGAWWDETTLAADTARTGFVPSTRATAGDPVPAEPRHLRPAA